MNRIVSHRVPAWPTAILKWRLPVRTFSLLCALIIGCNGLGPAAPVYAQETVHVVQRGESLTQIARQHAVELDALMALNGITNANVIFIGQRLLIPGNPSSGVYGTPATAEVLPGNHGYYVAGRGDTLSQIAQQHGMSLTDIMRLNSITNPATIHVGQRLRVTARAQPLAGEQPAQPQVADQIYVVQRGDSLHAIAARFDTTVQALMAANGLPNPNFVWEGQRLRIRAGEPLAQTALVAAGAPEDGKRWIEISLSNQTLTAWQGDVAVMHTAISSGTQATPTVKGRYAIERKYSKQRMTGPDYDLPNVPWVMYFHLGYAIHGAYWHAKFGSPTSHGCINMRIDEAEMLYHWADHGTEVYVH